jgi:hypothetical protein
MISAIFGYPRGRELYGIYVLLQKKCELSIQGPSGEGPLYGIGVNVVSFGGGADTPGITVQYGSSSTLRSISVTLLKNSNLCLCFVCKDLDPSISSIGIY